MKVAIISDTHFGCKKNSPEFLESHLKFFREVFFPYLESEKIGTIIHNGDLFDNRSTLNVNVINEVDKLLINNFSEYKTYMLIGNHDSYFRNTINIHSLAPFRHIKNIHIVDEITQIDLDGKSGLLVPWQVDKQKFIKKVLDKNFYNDICFGHFEINGFHLNNAKLCDFGFSPELFFQNYGLTFSGHFHIRKKMERMGRIIQYNGSPYELTRADRGQPKGFCILDTETMKYEFINNDVSIKHKLFTYPEKFLKKDIEGNIIDVVVDIGDNHNEKEFQKYMMNIDSFDPYTVDLKLLNNIDVEAKTDYKIQNTEELMVEYVNDIECESELKNDVNTKTIELYKRCKQER